jgi:hypothetical protein
MAVSRVLWFGLILAPHNTSMECAPNLQMRKLRARFAEFMKPRVLRYGGHTRVFCGKKTFFSH